MAQVLTLEVFINRSVLTVAQANNELAVVIYRFFKYMETEKGWWTQIARNTGAGPGVNTGDNFWDEASPALDPFFSYWRWNASARRPNASYLLQSSGLAGLNTGVNAPSRILAITNPSIIGVGFAWAGKIVGGVAVDPWAGVAPTTKASPVFSPAVGIGQKLYLLPIANATGGNYAATNEACAGAAQSTSYTTSWRVQMSADQDNVFIQCQRDSAVQAWSFLLSAFIPADGVTLDFPVVMCNSYTTSSASAGQSVMPADTVAVGAINNNSAYEGGVVRPNGVVSAANILSNYGLLTAAGKQPNTNASPDTVYDALAAVVTQSAGGRLGVIDPEFLPFVGAPLVWGAPFTSPSAVVLDSATASRSRALARWDGVTVPGSGVSRNGVSSFT